MISDSDDVQEMLRTVLARQRDEPDDAIKHHYGAIAANLRELLVGEWHPGLFEMFKRNLASLEGAKARRYR